MSKEARIYLSCGVLIGMGFIAAAIKLYDAAWGILSFSMAVCVYYFFKPK